MQATSIVSAAAVDFDEGHIDVESAAVEFDISSPSK
jgi:hypothetical protein